MHSILFVTCHVGGWLDQYRDASEGKRTLPSYLFSFRFRVMNPLSSLIFRKRYPEMFSMDASVDGAVTLYYCDHFLRKVTIGEIFLDNNVDTQYADTGKFII